MEPDRVARARCGDGAAFEALVDARAGPMVRTAMAIPGNESDASDAVQDALVTAWRELASSPALGVDAPSRVSAGPFQVRSGLVVARHDPSAVITVDLPPVRCSLARGTVLPSCSDIADEAIAAVSPIGPVTSIEVDQGADCPPGLACPTVEPGRVHVSVNSPTGDWLVELAYGRDGSLVSVQTRQLSSGGPASPAA